MSSKSSQSVKIPKFGKQMRDAFSGKTNAEIARLLGKTESAVSNYIDGRVTLPLVIQISELTGCSIDWLLTGEGEKFVNQNKQINLDETFRAVVREIVGEEIAKLRESPKTMTLPLDVGSKKEKKENKAA